MSRVVVRKRGLLGRGGKGVRGARTYGEGVRSFRRFGGGEGFRAESWTFEGTATSFDAEVAAVVWGIKICLMIAGPGDSSISSRTHRLR